MTPMKKTKEPQYQNTITLMENKGLTSLGLMTNQVWADDPRRLVFVLSRYKFVSKMFRGKNKVLEVGCADAFGTRIVRQEVSDVVAVDFDPLFVEDVNRRKDEKWNMTCREHDMLKGPVDGDFDGAYSLDVIEHIERKDEDLFIKNITLSLKSTGVLILGSPTIQSQVYASAPSKEGHVNCKDEMGMRELLNRHFENIFIFSMNDEVVHTGFTPMAHYLLIVCCNRKY